MVHLSGCDYLSIPWTWWSFSGSLPVKEPPGLLAGVRFARHIEKRNDMLRYHTQPRESFTLSSTSYFIWNSKWPLGVKWNMRELSTFIVSMVPAGYSGDEASEGTAVTIFKIVICTTDLQYPVTRCHTSSMPLSCQLIKSRWFNNVTPFLAIVFHL